MLLPAPAPCPVAHAVEEWQMMPWLAQVCAGCMVILCQADGHLGDLCAIHPCLLGDQGLAPSSSWLISQGLALCRSKGGMGSSAAIDGEEPAMAGPCRQHVQWAMGESGR